MKQKVSFRKPSRLKDCWNAEDFRAPSRRRLPAPLFHYLDGGADDEWSLENNQSAFDRYQLIPRVLCDVSDIDLRTRVLGADISMPLICAPTGMTRLFHESREPAVARAASRAGILYSLSTLATTSIEDVAASASGPKMFQVYVFKDRELTRDLVQRCKAAGFSALCLTVDTAMAGNRERDNRTGMVMPPRLGLMQLAQFAAKPAWSLAYLRDRSFELANVVRKVDALKNGALGLIQYINGQFDRSVTWKDAEDIRAMWDGPFAIKGILSADDAVRAASIGASAVILSNHGGRQLDGSPAPVDCIRTVRNEVGENLEIILDGGIRRGSHIVKALALGANACSIGRPYLYALSAFGEPGVDRLLDLLRTEVIRTMTLAGYSSTNRIGPEVLATPLPM